MESIEVAKNHQMEMYEEEIEVLSDINKASYHRIHPSSKNGLNNYSFNLTFQLLKKNRILN